ncbi:MAG: hypothetical protein DHS20C20_10620 [Ardenticatenaceae bacterium]|nr:MAG: hypothetical protein DHS20C20_10620 [Ardenticatenaceae bacterium]
MTPATEEKRAQFLPFMEKVMLPETAVKAIIGIGSITIGYMHPNSNIILFLDPYDPNSIFINKSGRLNE